MMSVLSPTPPLPERPALRQMPLPGASPLDAQLTATFQSFVDERPPAIARVPADDLAIDEDVHMLASVVDHVIDRCTRPGEVVFDPFAGFGTTLERAVALGREAVGIELLPERVVYLRERVPGARVVEGDARELARVIRGVLPPPLAGSIDLVFTSPPYMTEHHHPADPLTAYEQDGSDYARYLAELSLVAAQCALVVRPGGFVVWNVADIHYRGHTTQLINDCRAAFGTHLTLVGVTEVVWDQLPHDLVRDALLVFQRPISSDE